MAVQGFQRVSRATRTMQKMIDTLRQYTQLDALVEFGPVAMQTVVEDGLSAMQQTLAEHNAVVRYENLPEIRGNAPQLVQLMQTPRQWHRHPGDGCRPRVRRVQAPAFVQ